MEPSTKPEVRIHFDQLTIALKLSLIKRFTNYTQIDMLKIFIFWPEKICETQKKVNTGVQNTVDYVEIKICNSIQGVF